MAPLFFSTASSPSLSVSISEAIIVTIVIACILLSISVCICKKKKKQTAADVKVKLAAMKAAMAKSGEDEMKTSIITPSQSELLQDVEDAKKFTELQKLEKGKKESTKKTECARKLPTAAAPIVSPKAGVSVKKMDDRSPSAAQIKLESTPRQMPLVKIMTVKPPPPSPPISLQDGSPQTPGKTAFDPKKAVTIGKKTTTAIECKDGSISVQSVNNEEFTDLEPEIRYRMRVAAFATPEAAAVGLKLNIRHDTKQWTTFVDYFEKCKRTANELQPKQTASVCSATGTQGSTQASRGGPASEVTSRHTITLTNRSQASVSVTDQQNKSQANKSFKEAMVKTARVNQIMESQMKKSNPVGKQTGNVSFMMNGVR